MSSRKGKKGSQRTARPRAQARGSTQVSSARDDRIEEIGRSEAAVLTAAPPVSPARPSLPGQIGAASGLRRRRQLGAFVQEHAPSWRSPGSAAAAVVLLAGVLRFYHSLTLSLWLDEGFTIAFSRFPWLKVMGFQGAYDGHPPLYPTVIKLAAQLLPEVTAARMVSVLAGTLTVAVLYMLVARLINPWAGVLAGLVLAVSPVHIWYSQDARPYALNVLLVALSYLGLVAFYQSGRWPWAALYGLSVCLAMYVEYSAIFALVPQAALLPAVVKAQGRRTFVLLGAALCAVLGYLPWLHEMISAAGWMSRGELYAVSPASLWASILSLVGLGGNTYYFWGSQSPAWDLWPDAHGILFAPVTGAVLLGALALVRRSSVALIVALGLLIGTILVALAVSQRYPSFQVRTILYAILGWAFLVGAAPFCWRLSRLLGVAGAVGVAGVLLTSSVTLGALYGGAAKQDFRGLAQATDAAARFGWPIMTYPTITPTLIDVYYPRALAYRHIDVGDGGGLPPVAPAGKPLPVAVWASYLDSAGVDVPLNQLNALHYERVMHVYFYNPLHLDLYLRREAQPGTPLDINGRFDGAGSQATGWLLPQQGVSFEPDLDGGRQLTMANTTVADSMVMRSVPAGPGNLYILRLDVRSRLQSGSAFALLTCQSPDNFLSVAQAPVDTGLPNDGKWHTARAAAVCPAGTTAVGVNLRKTGTGPVSFRAVELSIVRPVRSGLGE